MDLMKWLLEQHLFLMHQCFSLPFAFLFYFLAKCGFLPLTFRYLFVSAGGCVLAVVTMGVYSSLLFTSTLVFVLLVCSVDASSVHSWVFGIQMLWQTFWHLLIQYREYYLHEPVCIRLFLAVSSLMLLTQRITSVSMDLQERRVVLSFDPSSTRCQFIIEKKSCVKLLLLPLVSYCLNFTTLLGGPLCSYRRFLSLMSTIHFKPPPNPLGTVSVKLMQVLTLEWVRHCLVCLLRHNTYDPFKSMFLHGVFRVWVIALVLRIQYYSHWRMSESLNNAAGFGSWENWSGLSDGDIWRVEASSRMSDFARGWNETTASWLRRLVYNRCAHFPLLLTFAFSLWWHGLHPGQCVGMLTWAATVKADYRIDRHFRMTLSPTLRRIYRGFSWVNTQINVSFIVIAMELRNMSGLRILSATYIFLFPLVNIILNFILLKMRPSY